MEKLALAAFLHDIGKFRQRAGLEVSEELKSQYCPSFNGKYSHLHAAHTVEAIDEMGLKLKKEDLTCVIRLAASHHLSNLEGDEEIVQIADRYASSLDRKESYEELKKNEFITSAIETPFSYVYLNNLPKKHYYPLQKLEGDLKITSQKNVNSKEEYKELYKEFISEVKKESLRFDNLEDFLKIKSIYEKYTTFIPSSTYKTYPDVSLFDHSLATAAIAVAIKNGNKEEFSLIQGDFTSIQSFIFSKKGESNKHLAKILRAKSLFVNIATEIVALRVVKELNLSVFNIVMNAGGKFTILAHKLSKEDKKKLEEIKKWVNNEFMEVNFLSTKFVIKSIDFGADKFKLGKFSEVYKDLALAFEEEKLRFIPEFNQFDDYLEKAKNGVCEVCGIVSTKDKVCRFCKKFEDLGGKLVVVEGKYINFDLDSLFSIDIGDKPKGLYYGFREYPIKRVANVVPVFSKDEVNAKKYKLIDSKEVEAKEEKVKSFYHIAVDGLKEENEEFYGRKYLAVLKADIDNLGKIFICGFRREETFSRILYLSRMIDYFFTTVLMEFVKNKNIYTVFAGGDDLFLIGHYEDIVDVYEFVVKKFRDYTKNDDFHLSASIKFFRPNVPVHLVAEFAEEELDIAKKSGKNSVSIFDVVYKNNEFLEFLEFREFFEELYEKLKKVNSGSSFMYRFYDFIEMAYNLKDGKDLLKNSRWVYMMKYLIEKNFEIKRNDKHAKTKEEIKSMLYLLKAMIEKDDIKLILPLNLFMYSIRKY